MMGFYKEQMNELASIERISVLGNRLSVSDAMGRTYTYLGDVSDVTPDDIAAMQANPPVDGNRILRNLADLQAWRTTHKLDINGYSLEKPAAPRGRANRRARIARANAKRK